MKKGFIIALLSLSLVFSSCNKDNTSPEQLWMENIGSRTDLPFLPDGNVNYFGYSFLRKPGDQVGIRFKARYGFARYMSFNVYDNSTRSSLASLVDTDILPEAGSLNPFTAGTQPTDREYVVNLLPDIPEAHHYPNALFYDDKITNVGTLLRYYMPEIDNYGGVSLPEIEAFDLVTGRKVLMPETKNINFNSFKSKVDALKNVIDLTQLLQSGNELFFFRFSGAGLYQNNDNKYLFSPVSLGQNEVIMFRFIPPSYSRSLADIPTSDVRYYSLCIGDAATYNYVTRADHELKVASDGYIYVVIARETPEVKARANGLNFIPWPEQLPKEGLIVYRNLLTRSDYSYQMTLVPDILENIGDVFNPVQLAAHTFLGDRAPLAYKMSMAAYLADFGGFEVAY